LYGDYYQTSSLEDMEKAAEKKGETEAEEKKKKKPNLTVFQQVQLNLTKRRYKIINESRGYTPGGEITFDVYDNSPMEKRPEKTIMFGGVEDIPEFEIRFNCNTGKEVDAFIAADLLKGKIVNMVVDLEAPLTMGRQTVIVRLIDVVGIPKKKHDIIKTEDVITKTGAIITQSVH